MKISINLVCVMFLLIPLSIQTGCKDQDTNLQDAQADVKKAKQVLKEANADNQSDNQIAMEDTEWLTFKAESEEKIKKNENRIAELRENIKESGKTMDAMYERKIENLEQKNNKLKDKISTYDKNQGNWESFKTEFNHDMDELGKAFKGLIVDDEK